MRFWSLRLAEKGFRHVTQPKCDGKDCVEKIVKE
jgi:hypothetical protein